MSTGSTRVPQAVGGREAGPGTGLPARLLIGTIGVLGGLYGAYLLFSRNHGVQLHSALKWFVGGIIVHDAAVAVAAFGLGVVFMRVVPRWLRAPLSAGLVILTTVTIAAIPVLGRYGVRSANPTLLDRHYTVGWLVLAALVAVGVAVGVALERRGHRTGPATDGEVATNGAVGEESSGDEGAGGRRRPDGA